MYAVIHDEMLNSLSHLDAVTKSKVVLAYVEYQINWTEPSQDDLLVYSIFKAKQFDLDSTKSRAEVARENWKKWGRPRKDLSDSNLQKTKETQQNPTETKNKPNETQKNQEKEKEKEKEKENMEEKENKEKDSTTSTTKSIQDIVTEQSARISYMNGMRNVEIWWKQLINKRNAITHREEFMNEDLKKAIYNLQGITLDAFEDRVKKYQHLVDKIQETKAEKLFYYPIREWDLLKFISKINLFYWDDSIIISKIAHKDWVIKDRAVRLLTQEKQKEENYSDLLEKIY